MSSPPASSLPFAPAASSWVNRFAQLGPAFFTEMQASGVPSPAWLAHSPACAQTLGWPEDWWVSNPPALEVLSGNALWPGMRPLASVYSGHQFGVWAGQLGDGRALLLGELNTPNGPMEIQLKGAGQTPYSRMGDGRAVLRSTIRELLCSEALHHLGVPTTRALCATHSPLPVRRERAERAAVVTRVAPSFIRFGHFEHFAHHGLHAELRQLLDFVLAQHFPACQSAPQPALALLGEVTRRTARLMAHWQALGFCHGVMNTDNMSILGLTIDYGPFGFLDGFDPHHICNHSDERGRYAFERQPHVAWWNLHALAQALVPVIGAGLGDEADVEAIQAELAPFAAEFEAEFLRLMRARLGLATAQDDDKALVDEWLRLLARHHTDYPIASRRLCHFSTAPGADLSPLRDLFIDRDAFDAWGARYAARLQQEDSVDAERQARMCTVVPKYVLRNHLAQQAIEQAERGEMGEVQRLLKVLSRPYDEQPDAEADAAFPPDWARHLEVSCSS
ncbi:protein adenylyltransferase SelO [Ideonella paludis]|uniref:Protein nucleotidyltransferase YdiU n=1 Tax=Ideonella paludis TaxID=1233411 RepID=A0ABS5E1K7_9BURK|nr:YdiU family protein [Ideonella paludis]MBQ0937291.1 YdiU family protein [Ideonella paludis]